MTVRLFDAALTVAAVAVLCLGVAWCAWRVRVRRGARLTRSCVPGTELSRFDRVLYVATTRAGAPLARVSAPSLMYRGCATVAVATAGVLIAVTGSDPVTIPAAAICDSFAARGAIDQAVERDGLAVFAWRAGEERCESGLRFQLPAENHQFHDAVSQFLQHPSKEDA